MTVTIRKMGINDVLKLKKMYLSLSEDSRKYFHPFKFNEVYLVFMFTFLSISNKINKLIKRSFPKLFIMSFIALKDNKTPVGFAYIYNLSKSDDNFWEAKDFGIVIEEKCQGYGIGSKLIQKIINSCIQNRIDKINLTVFAENTNAIHLYEKFGFKLGKYHQKREFWNGNNYPDYNMCLKLMNFNER